MLNNPFDVPRNTLITFLNLGAVQQSGSAKVARPVIVYFWDADGQEVGLYDFGYGHGTTVTKGRAWAPETLATQQFASIIEKPCGAGQDANHPMTVPDTTEGQT